MLSSSEALLQKLGFHACFVEHLSWQWQQQRAISVAAMRTRRVEKMSNAMLTEVGREDRRKDGKEMEKVTDESTENG
eukprot:s5824_g10.t1